MQEYRADIDGLRGLSIIAVLGYHFRVAGFGGGFVGVDVFFVISGFLITQLIARESAAGTFSFARFYERRARRLFPALFAMLATTLVAGWFMLLPLQYRQLGTDAAAASAFAANIKYWLSGGYFDQSLVTRPLLHTWSLGVEEQYYLLYPVLLVALLKLGARRASIALAVLTIASLAISEYSARADALFAFYMLPSRAWELFLGGLVALAPRTKPVLREAGTLLFVSAMALIVVPVLRYSESTTFPGFAALLPCVGTAAILWQGAHEMTRPRKVLSLGVLSGLGLISYSLYLWHWPLLTFTRYWLVRDLTAAEMAAVLLASVAVSWLSWRFVERPVRFGTAINRTRMLTFSVAAIVVTIAMGIGVRATNGIPSRVPGRVAELARVATEPDPATYRCRSGTVEAVRSGPPCILGDGSGPVSYALIGDSHADMIAEVVQSIAARSGERGVIITHGGCAPLTGLSDSLLCDQMTNAALDRLRADTSIHTVIVAARWTAYTTGRNDEPHAFRGTREELLALQAEFVRSREFGPGLRRTFDALAGKRIIVVASVPEQRVDVPYALAMSAWRQVDPPRLKTRLEFAEAQKLIETVLAAPERSGEITVVRPGSMICPSADCLMMQGNTVLYRDANHLSREGAMMLQPLFASALNPAATSSRGRP